MGKGILKIQENKKIKERMTVILQQILICYGFFLMACNIIMLTTGVLGVTVLLTAQIVIFLQSGNSREAALKSGRKEIPLQ